MGDGLRVRFAKVRGFTPKGVLDDALYLPVVLNEFTFSEEAAHQEYDTVAAGQFSVPAAGPATARQLRSTDFETLTLDWDAPWLARAGQDDQDVRRELYKVLRARAPFELLATLQLGRGTEELRMKATLRSIERTLKPGERDTRYYTLALKEWRDPSVERRGAGSAGRGHSSLPTTAVLKADTTFTSLAGHYYGLASRAYWAAIANANGLRSWGGNTPIVQSKRFKVGDKVKIPKKPIVASTGTPGVPRATGGRAQRTT